MELKSNVPPGPIEQKWTRHKFDMKLVNPSNKRKYSVIVVGSGLAGGSAAASLAELGYQVSCFCYQDSPRRAHSIAAQGGINAAKNYQNDGDSVYRLFYDTVKGGRLPRPRGQRLPPCRGLGQHHRPVRRAGRAVRPRIRRSAGEPVVRRRPGLANLLRPRPDRSAAPAWGLPGPSAAGRLGAIKMFPRHEMQELVVIDGKARGIVTRDLETGTVESYVADAVILASGGYGTVFYLATYAKGCNTTAIWRAYKKGAAFANPCYTQIHPTCIPVTGDHQSKLTLMSESLRNDGRIWVSEEGRHAAAGPDSRGRSAIITWSESTRALATSSRDISSRAAKEVCDEGRGVGKTGLGVYLDFAEAINRLGVSTIRERYGNLFDMYERITDEDPYKVPMRIYPAMPLHDGRALGGLPPDEHDPGVFVLGEANFSDHGANRLGASALMQGLADGYFVIPYTLGNYFASNKFDKIGTDHSALQERRGVGRRTAPRQLLGIKGKRTVDDFHRELGKIMWNYCGMARNEQGLKTALEKIPALREEFWKDVRVLGDGDESEPVAREGRACRRLSASWANSSASTPWNAGNRAGGHFREEYPDPGRRGGSATTRISATSRPGSTPARATAPTGSSNRLNFENVHLANTQLQVMAKSPAREDDPWPETEQKRRST